MRPSAACGATAPPCRRCGGAPISMGEGRTPLVPRADRRRHRAPEMRVVHADRLLQGPRRLRDALPAPRPGRRGGAGGLLRQWRRGRRGLCGGGRDAREDPGAREHLAGQDRACPCLRRGDRAGAGQPAGLRGRGAAPGRLDLLRQPQLAPLLPPGHQDPRLRALGRPRLLGARQRGRALRRRLQRARLRHRLRRVAVGAADRAGCPGSSPPSRRIARPSPAPS